MHVWPAPAGTLPRRRPHRRARSQLPYPYVALVSFAIHFYLFVLATWFGSLLHGGFPSMVPRLTSGNVEAFNDFCDSK